MKQYIAYYAKAGAKPFDYISKNVKAANLNEAWTEAMNKAKKEKINLIAVDEDASGITNIKGNYIFST